MSDFQLVYGTLNKIASFFIVPSLLLLVAIAVAKFGAWWHARVQHTPTSVCYGRVTSSTGHVRTFRVPPYDWNED